jgi:hypothetical protein
MLAAQNSARFAGHHFHISHSPCNVLQHGPSADTEQIAHHGRQLDTALFQQTFHVIMDHAKFPLHLYTRSGQPAPAPLFGAGYEAVLQISCTPPVCQPLCIPEIPLAPPWRARLQGVAQMLLEAALPCVPDRPPVLRRRFHCHFAYLQML